MKNVRMRASRRRGERSASEATRRGVGKNELQGQVEDECGHDADRSSCVAQEAKEKGKLVGDAGGFERTEPEKALVRRRKAIGPDRVGDVGGAPMPDQLKHRKREPDRPASIARDR